MKLLPVIMPVDERDVLDGAERADVAADVSTVQAAVIADSSSAAAIGGKRIGRWGRTGWTLRTSRSRRKRTDG